jgi:putative heme-binding domain-containing protein
MILMPRRIRPLLCVALLAATVLPSLGRAPLSDSKASPELEQGRKLYQTHCATCHGPNGEGARGPTLAQPKLARAGDPISLLRIIREGINGTEMPRSRLERDEIMRVAMFVKSLGERPPEVVPGDPKRGAHLYATKGTCARCHMLNGEGGVYGPDLTDIGRMRSAAYLRRSLTDPNAEVPQSYSSRGEGGLPANFLYLKFTTPDGEVLDGIRVNEDAFSIQIREATGRLRSYFKSDLGALHKEWGKSPMPKYDSPEYSSDEIDDLVAFLVSLRG